MQKPATKHISPEEYLAMEDAAESKSEYYYFKTRQIGFPNSTCGY